MGICRKIKNFESKFLYYPLAEDYFFISIPKPLQKHFIWRIPMKSKKTNKFVLIGIPNSGKSTIGLRAAEKLQIPFYNTDKMVCERLNLVNNPLGLFSKLMQIMEEHRKLEAELAELESPAIIEVYPESVLTQLDVKVMRKLGTVIHVRRDLKTMLAEAKKKKSPIVLQYMNTGRKVDMQSEGIRLYAEELHHFEKLADLTLDNNGNKDEAVEKLVAMIRNHIGT
jgi:shikimate kinase